MGAQGGRIVARRLGEPWRMTACLTVAWVLGVATASLALPNQGPGVWAHIGIVALVGGWSMPLFTAPAAWLVARRFRGRYDANRWTYVGLLLGVTLGVALVVTLVLGPLLAIVGGALDPTSVGPAVAEPVVGALIWGAASGLPLWLLLVGLVVGPAPAAAAGPPEDARPVDRAGRTA